VVLAIAVVALILWSVVAGLLGREREILAQVTAGLDEGGSLAGTGTPDTDQAVRLLGDVVQLVVSGLLSGLSSATVLIVGVVTGLFILLFLMKDWAPVTNATATQIAGRGSRSASAARSYPTPSARSGATPLGSPSSGS
jgi:predicted PurR-regulated permease PerM